MATPTNAAPSLLLSPRTNLDRLLALKFTHLDEAERASAAPTLLSADAENKLYHKKLYLALDLDETLVYSKRMPPGATPVGTQIFVRGSPFDMVPRPGLQHFLQTAERSFVLYLYTMGDQEYTEAVLKVIDPAGRYFRGGVCTWRPSESRTLKTLNRVLCEPRMALIIDDSIDVWQQDLPNLCFTRRFVGDEDDEGLQLLSWQLATAHKAFFEGAPSDGFSYSSAAQGSPRAARSMRDVLSDQRGSVLAGCRIALTGIVADLNEEKLESGDVPLGTLLQLYGGSIVLDVKDATHLVARKKDGWRTSAKIKKGLQRIAEAGGSEAAGSSSTAPFHAVWDHWLLDTLASWQRQSESNYAILEDDDEEEEQLAMGAQAAVAAADGDQGGGGGAGGGEDVDEPARKRMRAAEE